MSVVGLNPERACALGCMKLRQSRRLDLESSRAGANPAANFYRCPDCSSRSPGTRLKSRVLLV